MTENLFKNIVNSIDLRKEILQTSKTVIETLKSYQQIINIRERKGELIESLKIQLKEIRIFLDKTKELFPTEILKDFEEEKAKQKADKKKTTSKKGKKGAVKKELKKEELLAMPSELEQLEDKLEDIEEKLKALS